MSCETRWPKTAQTGCAGACGVACIQLYLACSFGRVERRRRRLLVHGALIGADTKNQDGSMNGNGCGEGPAEKASARYSRILCCTTIRHHQKWILLLWLRTVCALCPPFNQNPARFQHTLSPVTLASPKILVSL